MYSLNKLVGSLANPVVLAWIGVLLALVVRLMGWKRLAKALLFLCIVWTWLWATPFVNRKIGASLEREYLVDGRMPTIESSTNAVAIVLHGGSMGDDSGIGGRGEMWTSADRVWMAARLWKAGKAPVIYVTGGGVRKTTAGLLEDFGIPTNAVVFAESPRNTEEEVKHVAAELPAARVLVVTSAWHMKRTMMMYAMYAPTVEAIPAPCDFENTLRASGCATSFADFLPNDETLLANRIAAHEWIGIWGYRCFRR